MNLTIELASELNQAIKNRLWTQTKAASVLGIKQPHVSELVNGKLEHFSVERLIELLRKLDSDITITISYPNNVSREIFLPAHQ